MMTVNIFAIKQVHFLLDPLANDGLSHLAATVRSLHVEKALPACLQKREKSGSTISYYLQEGTDIL